MAQSADAEHGDVEMQGTAGGTRDRRRRHQGALAPRGDGNPAYDSVVNPDVTQLLSAVENGDPTAAEQLLPLVYEELRRLAAARMAQQPGVQTLQATALVHEAWLRLVDGPRRGFASRRHFFATAAQAMRHLMIERARRRLRQRHGGGLQRVTLDGLQIPAPSPDDERLLQINAALDELAMEQPEKAEVVKLRFFVGLDARETADLLQLSTRTVERHWAYAKVWLFDRIAADPP